MNQNDKFLNDKLAGLSEPTAPDAQQGNSVPVKTKKSSGGTASFIVGFVFGLIGVLISFCWGGASAAFRGFLWRLGISIVVALLCAIAS